MIRDSLLIESAEDYVGLWTIPVRIRLYSEETDEFKIRRKTLQIIEELLNDALIQPGQFTDRDFELWKLSPLETIARIEAEWDALGREPNIGEIVWFIATEKGEREVNSLKQK